MPQTTLAEIGQLAKQSLIKQEKHIPKVIGKDNKGKIFTVLCPFRNDRNKDLIRKFLSKFVSEHNIIQYWFICEAYTTKIKELLMICEFNKNLLEQSWAIEFIRDGKNIKILSEETNIKDKPYSMWNVYLEDDISS